LGRGATAAHQTLDLWILVRIQAPQPDDNQLQKRLRIKPSST
jgi:hypothetical protein